MNGDYLTGFAILLTTLTMGFVIAGLQRIFKSRDDKNESS